MKFRKCGKLILASALFVSVVCASCGKSENPSGYYPEFNICVNGGDEAEKTENSALNENGEGLLPVKKIFELFTKNQLSCAEYDKEKFFTPFYKSQVQYAEGFFLLENEGGKLDDVTLAFPAAKVLEVRSNDLKTLYKEGTDYVVKGGKLSFPAGSAIEPLARSAFFKESAELSGQWRYEGDLRPVANTTGEMYPAHYVCTYVRTSGYSGAKANDSGKNLTKFKESAALKNGTEILLVGDSISAGAGASGNFPIWAKMTEEGAAYYSGGEVTLHNAAQPGIDSTQYVALMEGRESDVGGSEEFLKSAKEKFAVAEEHVKEAALAIIAIGANDAGGWCGNGKGTPEETYEENVRKMIAYIRRNNPDCNVLLVSCMQTNPKLFNAEDDSIKLCAADLSEYEKTLEKIAASETGVATANVFSVQRSLLKRKKIEDMLGDNVNHPSDYMARIYAQVILDTLFGK